MSTYDQVVGLIREFGFPVFVVVWFMWRMEKRVDRLFELLTSLLQAMALLAKAIDHHFDTTRTTGAQDALEDGNEP